MSAPLQRIFHSMDIGNARVWQGNPNGAVYGETGWTCQDWNNGLLYVCTANGLSNWLAVATSGATVLTASAAIDFGIIPPQNVHERVLALPGAQPGDAVALGLPASLPSVHLIFDGRVTAAGVVSIRCINYDGGHVSAGVLTVRATVVR